jgi:hypothetical protein
MSQKTDIMDLVDAVASRAKTEEALRIVKLIQGNRVAPDGLDYANWLITLICEPDANE